MANIKEAYENHQLRSLTTNTNTTPRRADLSSGSLTDNNTLSTPTNNSAPTIRRHTFFSTGQHNVKLPANMRQKTWPLTPISQLRVHVDGGANRSITHNQDSLLNFRNIKKYPMSGVAAGDAALICTGVGLLPWRSDTGEMVFVRCYYSSNAADTIVSPTDVVVNNIADYDAWSQYSNIDTGQGYVEFHNRHTDGCIRFSLTSSNGLWFHAPANTYDDYHDIIKSAAEATQPTICRLTKAAEYGLAHFRYGCAGQRNLSIVHLHVDNQPKLCMPNFFKCNTCMIATGDHRATSTQDTSSATATFDDWFEDNAKDLDANCDPGQHFHVDFGFMKGSDFCKHDEEGQTITTIDGYRSYFLIIDRKTRFVWIFLTKNKKPPLKVFAEFLKQHGHPTAQPRTVRSDRGGELWGSEAFREVVLQAGYIMDPTAPDAAFQNGKAERPNRNFGKTVRCLLYNANLGPEYWSFALQHAVYLKNRLPHCATNQVPLTAYTGKRPNAKRLKIFGCPIVVRNLGRRPAKLDLNTSAGVFLGYTATDKNVIYRDTVTGRFKTATHVIFDEAGYTLPEAERTPVAKILHQFGYGTMNDEDDVSSCPDPQFAEHHHHAENSAPSSPTSLPPLTQDVTDSIQPVQQLTTEVTDSLRVKFLSVHATLPTRATDGSAGYDLFSAVDKVIQPNTRCAVPLDIAITPPPNTYAQIFSRSGMSLKHNVDVRAGTIDRDYTGNIQVILDNMGEKPFTIKIGDRIAQMVILQVCSPVAVPTGNLMTTTRGGNGFGSTGTSTIPASSNADATKVEAIRVSVAPPITGSHDTTIAAPQHLTPPVTAESVSAPTVEKPFDLYFSTDPFDKTLEVVVPVKGDHPTLGILTEYCDYRQRLQVTDMALSTPGSRLKNWRTVIRKSYILKFNDFAIQSREDLEHAVKQTRLRKMLTVKMVIATDKSYGVHPMEGILQIHFDQLNTIAKHLEDIKRDRDIAAMDALPEPTTATVRSAAATAVSDEPPPDPPPAPNIELAQSFTKKQLQSRPDWPDWEQGIYKQLNQYWNQGMFSHPMPLPLNANALHMLWRYNLKACGTKKCRMVCNGSPRQKGTVTLGHTYANALDAASERLFWAIVANENLIAVGADVSNAFAEAPAPKAPLYLYIDEAFKDWWTNHLGNEPIPSECTVVRVHNAIQGHPESPRLWEKHIDKILRELGLTPTTHEPCLYSGTFNNERVLFLRQVDDFAVASARKENAMQLISAINDNMRIEVKHLGLIDRFNGMDIKQTRFYIKITCEKYLQKMIKGHEDLIKHVPANPIPLPADPNYIRKLESAKVPDSIPAKLKLKEEMGINYRQIIGEIIFPMMKCRPEIAPHAIKLSQYMENPAREHYEALRDVLSYLSKTIDDGIYYWRKEPRFDLPVGPMPELHPDNYLMDDHAHKDDNLYGYVDSDWGSDSNHRKSITGIAIMYAGGVIGYKCKYQDVIAHSSTEAEFTAACDAGKMILFFRSLLEDLGIEQHDATVLYEDNNGALLMANAQQPTRRTRHMDIKKFALLDWVEQDLVILKTIKTLENAADGLTKPLMKQLFHRHADTLLGKRIPEYVVRSITGLEQS